MKKIVTALLLIMSTSMIQQAQTFRKHHIDLNAGVGFGHNLFPSRDLVIGIPPMSVSLDYGLKDAYGPGVIGVGGIVGFTSFKDEVVENNSVSGYKYTGLFLGARGTYHLELSNNFEAYAGLMLYYVSLDRDGYGILEIDSPVKNKPGVSVIAGSKYYFSKKMALFAELGYSVAWFTVGATFKL